MRYTMGFRSLAVAAVSALTLAGCMTIPYTGELVTRPVVPAANEQMTLDQIIVLVDATGSMTGNKFRQTKALVNAFAGAMPDGTYEAGISSFSGVSEQDWVRCPLAPYDRARFQNCEARIVLLGSSTPLDHAIEILSQEMAGKTGNGALLVFSDGLVPDERAVYGACETMRSAHQGRLCIYTVHMGRRARGRQLLAGMTGTVGCGTTWHWADLDSPAAIDQMVRTIFFGPRAVEQAPPERGVTLLGDVLFDLDRDVLKPAGKVEVDKVVAMLKANPGTSIVIEGHTCDLGSNAYNMDLSQRRAQTVRNYLVSQGIDGSRLTTRAYGETRPAVPNTSAANRRLNRRITFVW
jgi:OmpA-OmpF porin, OOP family